MTVKKTRKKRSVLWKVEKDELQNLLDSSNSYREILEYFNMSVSCGNYKTLNLVISDYKLDTSIIDENRKNKASLNSKETNNTRKTNDEIFVENSTYTSREEMKKRMISMGKIYKCSECGVGDLYNGKSIVLQLDHINGINNDNRLKNLRFLCPNCHSQTETFAGKRHRTTNHCVCGNIISNASKFCHLCRPDRPTKIGWPSVEDMTIMVWEKPITHLSKDLGVSDVAINKFCKKHNITKPPIGFWNTNMGK